MPASFVLPPFASGPEPEPWGKAYSYSIFGHGVILLLLYMASLHKEPELKVALTEVNFIEKPVAVAAPKPEPAVEKSEGGGGPVDRMMKRSGRAMAKLTGRVLGLPGKAEPVAVHPELPPVAQSSPQGSPKGHIVTAGPIAGPIVAPSQIGMVGRKKGGLMPLAGRTEGGIASGQLKMPAGESSGNKVQIALAKEEVAAISKKESRIGIPLLSQEIGSGGGGKIRGVNMGSLGDRKKSAVELLKANPLEKDSWGNKGGPFSMEGPLKYRKIVKFELPPYPRWAEEKGIETSVSIRLWVDPKGRVLDNMYLEKASGYSELDALAKDYLRRFIFVPMPGDQAQENEWGVATFRFELKR